MDHLIEICKHPFGKSQALKYAKELVSGAMDEKSIMKIAGSNKGVISSRASWIIEKASYIESSIIIRNLPILIKCIPEANHNGTRRNLLNALSEVDMPLKYQSVFFDLCYKLIMKPDELVAVKVHALQIMANIARKHPDLQPEVKAIIDDQIKKNTVAFRGRAQLILMKFQKDKTLKRKN